MRITELDNVEVNLADGHKYAACDIKKGENIIKYGSPIGHATEDIKKGDHVHSHNVKTNLSGVETYEYHKDMGAYPLQKLKTAKTFMGYRRKNGEVGIRNEIWIIPTVGCINRSAQIIAEKTGAYVFVHPFGCSQLGGDHKTTQLILRGLVNHPNAAGVLVMGLGCENNNIDEFKKVLGETDSDRVKFLNAQNVDDEIEEGIKIVENLKLYASEFKREEIDISELKIGFKCGGSDGLSGITANPLVGRVCDMLTFAGGSAALTEVPEMFGAERNLMQRCDTEETFEKTVNLINDFKQYFISHNQVVYENPSPGNKAGGITTLEEKSLGCIQKGGFSPVCDVLTYGDRVTKKGLSLLNGPGNDIAAVTNLTAAGVHIILFTTGRGTPLGGPVPTLKISTNSTLADKKKNWIDFDAGVLATGSNTDETAENLLQLVLDTASGKEAKNELGGYREISIFKDGVML